MIIENARVGQRASKENTSMAKSDAPPVDNGSRPEEAAACLRAIVAVASSAHEPSPSLDE